MKFALSFIAGTAIATGAFASCPASSPNIKWNTHSGDQRVNAAFLQKTLPGMKVDFGSDGAEIYGADGTYIYRAGNQAYKAPSYKFYDDGTRCINYANPRFDLYVVNEKRLVLVNAAGARLEGKLMK
ncbi:MULTISPECIES: hypothetical protein [Halocynthiibacter]|uniref:Uncharacterized protein n=1 Tax=Halocynthiibacter halioticoli TaxID=2986804 RepID=A0AAE3IXM0_9RHOB|nr:MULTISPECIES: hypothetical protein [Halocynthiibacter]MCV6823884.1 hypothetical protein [Halocynthiibacter halioticoli]MCW4056885.1 hypothetical protein [Halocynthiibacter sp. SDUM655004]